MCFFCFLFFLKTYICFCFFGSYVIFWFFFLKNILCFSIFIFILFYLVFHFLLLSSSLILLFFLIIFGCFFLVCCFTKNFKKNNSKNVHALFLVFFHFLLWKTVQNIVIEKQPCILKTLQAKQNKMKNSETKRLWHRQSKSSFKIRFMLGAAEGGRGTKRTATSSPVMCLQISVAYPSQPRISPHWFRCILHTACTLFLGADLKYNPPPYLRKLTVTTIII